MLSKCIPSPLHPRVSLQTIWSKGWEQMAPGCIFSGCLVWPTQACKQRDKSVVPAQHNSSLSQHPGADLDCLQPSAQDGGKNWQIRKTTAQNEIMHKD